jgi:hypothetical protein
LTKDSSYLCQGEQAEIATTCAKNNCNHQERCEEKCKGEKAIAEFNPGMKGALCLAFHGEV